MDEDFVMYVDQVLSEADMDLAQWYYWDDGLCVQDYMIGRRIVEILNASGHFCKAKFIEKDLMVVFSA